MRLLRAPRHLLTVAALAVSFTGCGATNSLTLAAQSEPRPITEPLPLTLAERAIGGPVPRNVGLVVADSVVRRWGWRVAAVDSERAELETEWLYFTEPSITPTGGQQCEDGSDIGIRLAIEARAGSGDSVQFAVRGEARVKTSVHRDQLERMARRGFDAVSAALTDALAHAAKRSQASPVRLAAVTGEVDVARDGQWAGCTTVRP